MLDSIYHMTFKLLNAFFVRKRRYFAIFYATFKWTSLCNFIKSINQFYCMVLFHS